eukprot:TRINITY_DN1713_c0_g1_i11.p1 TRINITY_DN1713_c0_g1~~TRINITY_DN1713_c0_g1_i11.p1  ORF type:complete len:167 (-),score=21.91 TRINITY_DN1713_c0_g1_i11:67-567(-)
MNRAYLLAIGILVATGDASSQSFNTCFMNKIKPAMAVCGKEMRCSPACESAIKRLGTTLDGSCCAEIPPSKSRSECDEQMPHAGALILSRYHTKCPSSVGDFAAVLMDVMPFGYYANDAPVVEVANEHFVNLGVFAVGAVIAGAVGASVAMVVASWNVRKQALLAN